MVRRLVICYTDTKLSSCLLSKVVSLFTYSFIHFIGEFSGIVLFSRPYLRTFIVGPVMATNRLHNGFAFGDPAGGPSGGVFKDIGFRGYSLLRL